MAIVPSSEPDTRRDTTARVAEARGLFHLAEAQRRPDVELGAGGDRDRSVNPAFGVPQTQSAGEGNISIAYDLDLFGRLANASKAARASLLASAAARRRPEPPRFTRRSMPVAASVSSRSRGAATASAAADLIESVPALITSRAYGAEPVRP